MIRAYFVIRRCCQLIAYLLIGSALVAYGSNALGELVQTPIRAFFNQNEATH
jgi:hypothetical protein